MKHHVSDVFVKGYCWLFNIVHHNKVSSDLVLLSISRDMKKSKVLLPGIGIMS